METWVEEALAEQTKQFKVIRRVKNDALQFADACTTHESLRHSRRDAIKTLGVLIKHSSYVIYTAHVDGLELHTVYTNGVVIIVNIATRKIVTYLIARPSQIKRYGITDPSLLALAEQHKCQNMHNA